VAVIADGGLPGFGSVERRIYSPIPTACSHLDQVRVTELPEVLAGSEECLRTGGWWVHLRMCLTCGKIGCCDQSPNRHASAHFRDSSHSLIRSAEPGEDWAWCFVDEITLVFQSS
jgi:uncharacterized UBP type Zn finger protein